MGCNKRTSQMLRLAAILACTTMETATGIPNNCHTYPEILGCLNSGSCVKLGREDPLLFTCKCTRTYCGKRCQANNPCLPRNPCHHQAKCECKQGRKDSDVRVTCRCPYPFTGQFCETIPIHQNPCYYSNDCPVGTRCEPTVIYYSAYGRSTVGYHCMDPTGSTYILKNQIPDKSRQGSSKNDQAGAKRKAENSTHGIPAKKNIKSGAKDDSSKSKKKIAPPTSNRFHACTSGSLLPNNGAFGGAEDSLGFDGAIDNFDDILTSNVQTNEIDDYIFGQNNEAGNAFDNFDDIQTSNVETSDIDDLIFGQNNPDDNAFNNINTSGFSGDIDDIIFGRTNRKSRGNIRKISIAQKFAQHLRNVKTRNLLKVKRVLTKQLQSGNPCMHRAQCIAIDHIRYKCKCPKGTSGKNCSFGCPQGRYGHPSCTRSCGHCLKDLCNSKSGGCPEGCLPGWQGRFCNERNGFAVSMVTTLKGAFSKSLEDKSSEQYKDLQNSLIDWIAPLCTNQLKHDCSIVRIEMSAGSVKLDYQVMFDDDVDADADFNITAELVDVLRRNSAGFNSTMYQVVSKSIGARRTTRYSASDHVDGRDSFLTVAASVSAGTVVCLLAIVLLLRRSSERQRHRKRHF